MTTESKLEASDLEALRQGDVAVLSSVIARWQRPLLAFAYRYTQNPTDAYELVAESFTQLYLERERLRTDTNLSGWLFTVLINRCRNRQRWLRRHPTTPLDEPRFGFSILPEHAAADACTTPSDALVEDEVAANVRLAIEELPHDLKVSVLLHYYERLSYREIAALSGCSERGIESRLHRARKRLKQSLGARLDEPLAHDRATEQNAV